MLINNIFVEILALFPSYLVHFLVNLLRKIPSFSEDYYF